MVDESSDRAGRAGEIVSGSLALASLIFADVTALNVLFGILLLVYWSRNFNRPSSISDRILVSMAMSLALLLFFSYPLHLILNSYSMALSWDIVLLILGIVAAILFFVFKSIFELRKSRGVT